MKIAFVLPLITILSGSSNGVYVQARSFASALTRRGHEVLIAGPGKTCDWNRADVIHVFGYWIGMDACVGLFRKRSNAKIILSPIIDTNRSAFLSRLATFCQIPCLHMTSPWSSLKNCLPYVDRWQARSEYESRYAQAALGVPAEKIDIVPLSVRMLQDSAPNADREDFCLHVSILSGSHKNVRRLIEAAIRSRFRLVLAGNPGDNDFLSWLRQIEKEHSNITVLGRVSDEKLAELYSKAKVFALPSLFEGVGLVALEAAAAGCEIVLTNRGAPKEYYNGMAALVDPESIDDIGEKITEAMNGSIRFQPALADFIKNKYSEGAVAENLENVYNI